ncbi:MAG: serine/threonine-protein kinase [Myxococcota bacterium]
MASDEDTLGDGAPEPSESEHRTDQGVGAPPLKRQHEEGDPGRDVTMQYGAPRFANDDTVPRQHPEARLEDSDQEPLTQFPGQGVEDYEPLPSIIGRFAVLEEIGRGGMGSVYAAYDEQLDRKVAVKVIHTHRRDGYTAQRRLQREAQAMARLSHPNVVTVHEVGEADGKIFVAMEFIRGQNLAQWIRSKPAWTEVVEVLAQAGRGLASAHAAGLVHRDLKPANMMLTDDGVVKVLDFGLARAAKLDDSIDSDDGPGIDLENSALSVDLTQTGTVLGTPAYMAPEQYRDEAPDARSDQFSFCVTLFEALYGYRPFQGTSARSIAYHVMAQKLRPPPTGTTVPTWLHRVVLRGLRRDPAERFESMTELVEAMLDDRDRRRNARLRWGLAGTVSLAGLATAGYLLLNPTTAPAPDVCNGGRTRMLEVWNPERAEAVQSALDVESLPYAAHIAEGTRDALERYAERWTAAHRDACEATHVRHEQTGALLDKRMACLDRRLVGLDASVELLSAAEPEVVKNALASVEKLPSVDACADRTALERNAPEPPDAETQRAVSDVQAQLERATADKRLLLHEKALAILEPLAEVVESIGHPPLEAEYLLALGAARVDAGKLEPGLETLRQALNRAQALGMDPQVRDAASRISLVLGSSLARPEEGLPWADLAEATDEQLGSTPVMQSTLLGRRAWILVQWRMKPEAIDVVGRAHAAALRAYGPDDFQMLGVYSSLGSVYAQLGELKRARTHFESAIRVGERHLSPDHPAMLAHYRNLGNALGAMNELDGADDYIRRAADLADRLPEINPLEKALIASTLGNQALKREDFQAAFDHHQRAMALRIEVHGPDHPMVARSANSLGATKRRMGDSDAALAWFQRSLEIREKAWGPSHPGLLIVLGNLGDALLDVSRDSEAVATFERAYAIMLESGGTERKKAELTSRLGCVLIRSGHDVARGLDLVGQAIELATTLEHERLLEEALECRAQADAVDERQKHSEPR